MRKWLIPCLLFGTLSAQHFENGTLYHSRYVFPQGKGMGHIGRCETRLAVTTPDGRTCVESLPGALEGRRGVCEDVAHHQGVSYAYGILNHPIFDRVGDAYFEKTQGSRSDAMPRAVFRKRGDGPWEKWLQVDESQFGPRFYLGMPFGGERFLIQAMTPQGSTYVFWTPDGKGGIRTESVPGLINEDPQLLARSQVLRIEDRVLLLPASGQGRLKWLDLKGQSAGEGRLKGAPEGMEIAQAAPRPDGRVLLMFQGESQGGSLRYLKSLLWKKREAASPSERLLKSYLEQRPEPSRMRPVQTGLWAVLDPASGQITKIQPPRNTRVEESMAVLPNGNLI